MPMRRQRNKSILVVDNESGFHDLFRFHLEPQGFVITSAYDGVQGWDLFQKQAFDIVFSDVHMPKMVGPELLLRIKQMKPMQTVVMMSSASDSQMAFERQSRQMGAVTCLYKPFHMDQLDQAIECALGNLAVETVANWETSAEDPKDL